MASSTELEAMRRALALAREVDRDRTHPNPRVGAVVLSADGRVVGEGFHRAAGQPHAEVDALAQAGADATGGTLVVTLEPCAHEGRTGPCTAAIVTAGVSRVVFGQTDPNPTAGGGARRLTDAGVEVEGDVQAEAASELNAIWTFAMTHGRPLVTSKVAATADGYVAATDGSSQWITGRAARALGHRLRATVDAVMVGTGTVATDDPQLTARDEADTPVARQPLRVVVGRRELPASARVLDDAADTLCLPSHDPREVLHELVRRDVHHVLVEGGPTLTASFLRAGVVDRVVWFTAPLLLGAGTPAIAPLGSATLSDARRFEFDDVTEVGSDLVWTARLGVAPAVDVKGWG